MALNQHEWGVVMHPPVTHTEVAYCPLCRRFQGWGSWKGQDLEQHKYISNDLALEIINDGSQYPGEFDGLIW